MENIFFSPISSFYRNKLYNILSREFKFDVIYLENKQDQFRSIDFIDKKSQYKKVTYSKFTTFSKIIYLCKILFNFKRKKIFICGWDKIEYWIIVLFAINTKKIFICDSFESKSRNFFLLKKIFLSKIDSIIVPGILHKRYINSFNCKKKIYVSKSVGIIDTSNKKLCVSKNKVKKIVYIGRLSSEKNISLLIALINDTQNLTLSIFGKDEINLKAKLRNKLKDRIILKGSISNKKVKNEIKKYDLLILPSKFEPWGLVVEEAIYNGVPVIVSDKVGCCRDLVTHYNVGYVFKNNSLNSLKNSFNKFLIPKNRKKIYENLSLLNYEFLKFKHLNVYRKLLK